MRSITMYTKSFCPFCVMAKQVLKSKGAEFQEINIGKTPERRAEMIEAAGGASTVPQIWIGDTHVGGCDELMALERAGRLDEMLAA
ncbi:MAG: glutaredoxin 3 [Pseudomonadota bacterium]